MDGKLVRMISDDSPSLLVYDLDQLRRRIASLQRALPGFVHCFAINAAPYDWLLRVFTAAGMGLEAASFRQVGLAQQAGAPTILFNSPCKTRTEIWLGQKLGLIMSANSLAELDRMRQCSTAAGNTGLRINPKVGDGAIAMTSTSGPGVHFGEPYDALPVDLPVTGLHVHVDCRGYSVEQLCLAARQLVETARRYPRVTWLNIGGGLPMEQDFAAYARALREAAPLLFSGRWRVYTEIGHALIARCGTALSRVEYAGNGVAIIHLGAEFLRRAYLPEDWHCRVTVLTPDGEEKRGKTRPQTIAGPLCCAGDVLERAELPEIAAGDIIAIHDVGAYTRIDANNLRLLQK